MLIHLTWKDRTANKVEDDLIVFEGDCSVKFINQLPEHRVFFVKMNQTKQRKFYWFQHTTKDKDEELIEHLSQALNNTGAAEARVKMTLESSGQSAKGLKSGADRTMEQLANLMSGSNAGASNDVLNQLMQSGVLGGGGAGLEELLQQVGGGGGSGQTAAAQATPSRGTGGEKKSKKVKLNTSDIKDAFGMVNQQPKERYDLTKVLSPDSLTGMLGNKEVQERLNQYMPKDEKISQNAAELRSAIGSPQYQQAVQAFQEALESGQLAPVLGQFKLPEKAIQAASTGNVKAFAEAMEADSKKTEASSSSTGKEEPKTPKNDKKDDDEDEKMAVD